METPIELDDIDRLSISGEAHADRAAGDEGVVLVSKGIICKSDEAMARLSGYRLEEVVDTIFASFFHQEDIPLVESICSLRSRQHSAPEKQVVRLIGKNGEAIPVQISVSASSRGRRPTRLIKIRHL